MKKTTDKTKNYSTMFIAFIMTLIITFSWFFLTTETAVDICANKINNKEKCVSMLEKYKIDYYCKTNPGTCTKDELIELSRVYTLNPHTFAHITLADKLVEMSQDVSIKD